MNFIKKDTLSSITLAILKNSDNDAISDLFLGYEIDSPEEAAMLFIGCQDEFEAVIKETMRTKNIESTPYDSDLKLKYLVLMEIRWVDMDLPC